jgi:hypothetical protein
MRDLSKKCSWCGVWYIGVDHETSCDNKIENDYSIKFRGGPSKRSHASIEHEVKCKVCNAPFMGYIGSKYCRKCQDEKAEVDREKHRIYQNEKKEAVRKATGHKKLTKLEQAARLEYAQTHYTNGPKWSRACRG